MGPSLCCFQFVRAIFEAASAMCWAIGMATCAGLAAWSALAILLQIAGLSLFLVGFFPVKPALSGVSGPESYQFPSCNATAERAGMPQMPPPDQLRSFYQELSGIPPSFDRLILMVIDGLPAEFVLGKGDMPPTDVMRNAMPYTQSLLSSGKAVGYHAKAAVPTVTMPRLKAMVSGAVGGFLDVAFNFNTQALFDDNLLGQFDAIGWKMVMFGDETWIKMFPGMFMRHDGVSSFFVKDTVEVDHNVTRHLDAELASDDWNFLILHYLGLDHVGHIGGRQSTLMVPKLKEMDAVIKEIHSNAVLCTSCLAKRTLLMIVSDHGMTNSGNHGGSSYEETDSLVLFVGLESKHPDYVLATQNTAFQVDIAPTLAILYGIPIPKNSVGVLMTGVLDSLSDEQKLRARKLNSWQLLRLMQAQSPNLFCGTSPCIRVQHEEHLEVPECSQAVGENLCCLLLNAMAHHNSWKSQKESGNITFEKHELERAVGAYDELLRTAAQWLSRRATNKPLDLLASGVLLLLVSCVTFISLVISLCKEADRREALISSGTMHSGYEWNLVESFTSAAVIIHVLSMGASSMVEEEQYIWHFLTSTLFLLFLRKTIQLLPYEISSYSSRMDVKNLRCEHMERNIQMFSVSIVLICGRLLRGWHQGGVNWTHLPDISKWLKLSGPIGVKLFQISSVVLVAGWGICTLCRIRTMKVLTFLVQASIFVSGVLIVHHIMENQIGAGNHTSVTVARFIFAILSVITLLTALASPWILPLPIQCPQTTQLHWVSISDKVQNNLLFGLIDLSHLIGKTYIVCWCLLLLLLQQPVNAGAIILMLLIGVSSVGLFSLNSHHKSWVEVATIYFLGMAGHFGLGNSNSLATIDVAGAFVGMSSHSTILSGILLFLITFASPLLFLLVLVIYHPAEEMKHLLESKIVKSLAYYIRAEISFHCLVPLALNSVALTTFTIVLLFMRNHLFVWSVFSPKFLYVCFATIGVYIGLFVVAVTKAYICNVVFFRAHMLNAKSETLAERIDRN